MGHFIDIQNVTFKYDEETREILSNINLSIDKGEFVSILGHNGCGKSTLAKHLNAILLPTSGKVFVSGMDTSNEALKYDIRCKVGLVQQNPDNQIVAGTVEEDVAFGPENLGVPPEQIRELVDNSLKTVGMHEYCKHPSDKLSGGQKQRVAIAGILAMQPDCIVLDEPTAMLDPNGRIEVIKTIERLRREKNISIVLITHYMDEAIRADRVIIMDKGKIVKQGSPKEIFSHVEFLKRYNLDVPQSIELIYQLRKYGYNLPKSVMTTEDCINVLQKLLEEDRCR